MPDFGDIRLEALNVLLNVVNIAVLIIAAFAARRVYSSFLLQTTAVGEAARHVRRLIKQNENLLTENERLWTSYTAAADDAERQRVRFLERTSALRDADAEGAAEPAPIAEIIATAESVAEKTAVTRKAAVKADEEAQHGAHVSRNTNRPNSDTPPLSPLPPEGRQ